MEDSISIIIPILVILFWVFLMVRMIKFNKKNNLVSKQDETIALLKEIKDELKNLNKNNSDKKL